VIFRQADTGARRITDRALSVARPSAKDAEGRAILYAGLPGSEGPKPAAAWSAWVSGWAVEPAGRRRPDPIGAPASTTARAEAPRSGSDGRVGEETTR
jgi:hypothetical protein